MVVLELRLQSLVLQLLMPVGVAAEQKPAPQVVVEPVAEVLVLIQAAHRVEPLELQTQAVVVAEVVVADLEVLAAPEALAS